VTPPLQTRSQLLAIPFLAVGAGAASSFFFFPLLGWNAVFWLAAAVSVGMLFALGHMAYRSPYGTAQGIATSSWTFFFFGLILSAASSAGLMLLTKDTSLAWFGMATVWVMLTMAFIASARKAFTERRAEGLSGAWFRASVDLERGWIADPQALSPDTVKVQSPVLLLAAALNLPLLWRSYGISDNVLLPWILLLLNLGGVWFVSSAVGPLMGRALYTRGVERQAGVKLVHRDLAQLQALRRSFWLSRWLMPRMQEIGAYTTPLKGKPSPPRTLKRRKRTQ
jgi:hypothetical protein